MIKTCPRCGGEMLKDQTLEGFEWCCLQCGYREPKPRSRQHGYAEKVARNRNLVLTTTRNPGLTFREIGESFGISRQMANKIFLKYRRRYQV